ncbi:MAG: glycosyltransferase [Nitrospirae bacterium]|nr:glycosyltransferase [Nitrospirota bacterium]
MFNVARHCELKVVAPVPWFPFIRYLKKDYRPIVPYFEMQEGIEVYHPKFFNIPRFFKFLDGFFFFISSIVTIMKIKNKFNFDLIDSHFAYPDGFGAVLLGKVFRKPVAITVRGTIKKLLQHSLIRAQIKYALKNAERVFTVCDDLKRVVTGLGIPENKTAVISNGVDIEKFKPMQKADARQALGLPMDKKIIVSVGGLVKRKGFHRVISAMPEIKKTIPDLSYIIIGGASVEGNYEPELRRMVKALELEREVIFAGAVQHSELYKWLSASDVFCLATSNEGWANVFLEAMACGLPVVTTNVGGNKEVVSSGDYGLLFWLDQKNELINALTEALNKSWDRAKIINYAGSNIWDVRVKDLLLHFQNVINLKEIHFTGRK